MLRNRNRNRSYVVQGQYGICTATGAWQGTPTTASTTVIDRDEMTDNTVPGFHKKRNDGNVFFNDLIRLTTKNVFTPCNEYWSYHGSGYTRKGVGQNWSLIDVLDNPRASNRMLNHPSVLDAVKHAELVAVTKAYSEAGKASAESLVSLGELPETLAFLMSPIAAATRFVKRFIRYHDLLARDAKRFASQSERYWRLPRHLREKTPPPKPVKRKLKLGKFEATDIASLWLAFRYGLMPLVYDIQDHWKAFQKLGQKPPTRQTARGKWSEDVRVDFPPEETVVPQIDKWVHTTSLVTKITSRAGVLYEPRIEGWPADFGLELHRLPSALWEWLPLSFVADWAVNVGEIINAMSVNLRVEKVLGAWVTTTTDFTYDREFHYTPLWTGVPGYGSWQLIGTHKTRRSTSLADVGLAIRVDMNGKRVADAIALFATFLKSALKRR